MSLNTLSTARTPLVGRLAARLSSRTARVVVVGLGYVGLPLAETFAWGGYPVIGFDIDSDKIARLRRGESYIGHICPERVSELNGSGRFEPTDDPARFGQSLRECSDQYRRFWIVRPDIHQDTDAPHPLALLRPRREWPGNGNAAKKCDEVAPPHMPPPAKDNAKIN